MPSVISRATARGKGATYGATMNNEGRECDGRSDTPMSPSRNDSSAAPTCREPTLRVSAFVMGAVGTEQRVLLIRQAKGSHTYWLLPGGHIYRGETIEQALVRELHEECRLPAQILQPPLALVETISPDAGRTRHVLQLILAALPLSEPQLNPEEPAVHELRWASSSELVNLDLHPPIADLLTRWLADFAAGPPVPWPAFIHAGVRWAK